MLADFTNKEIEASCRCNHESSQRNFDDVFSSLEFGEEQARRVLHGEVDHSPKDEKSDDVFRVSLKHSKLRDKEVRNSHYQSEEEGESLILLIVVKGHGAITCLSNGDEDEIYQHYNYIDSY